MSIRTLGTPANPGFETGTPSPQPDSPPPVVRTADSWVYQNAEKRAFYDAEVSREVVAARAETLEPFWRRLKASHARGEAVAIDMSAAYFRAVTENLPDAAVVFD